MKIENKTKNRRFKAENADKKHRKEQRKLRNALKDSASRAPRPLEVYKKRPGERGMEGECVDRFTYKLTVEVYNNKCVNV